MVRAFLNNSKNKPGNDLSLSNISPDSVSIVYSPSKKTLKATGLGKSKRKALSKRQHTLISIDQKKDRISVFPINTLPTHQDFLKPKYENIKEIILEGFGSHIPKNPEEVVFLLEELPSGFVKDYEYGLGLLKDYRFIINNIEEVENVNQLIISTREKTEIKGSVFWLSYDDFEILRKGINRISSDNQSKSRVEKNLFSYNSLLSNIDSEKYPEKKKPYKKDIVYKLLSNTAIQHSSLSAKDSGSLLGAVSANKKNIFKTNKAEVLELLSEIELLNFHWLIEETGRMLSIKTSENEWQRFLSTNPIILYLVFGYPVVKLQDQASIGGRTVSGSGDKITDFLFENRLTHNCALVEIKKPGTPLLRKGKYRNGVYPPSNELAGSIAQVLDQKYKFQREISILKDNSGLHEIESYSVDCMLIIGTIPDGKNQIKSFEQYRHNSHDVNIFTFDEVYENMKGVYSALSSSVGPE